MELWHAVRRLYAAKPRPGGRSSTTHPLSEPTHAFRPCPRLLAAPPLHRHAWPPRRPRLQRRSSASRSPASAAPRCRWPWPPSATRTSAPVPVSAIVRADLQRSGLFRIVDAPGSFDESSRINVAEWRGRGADALAVGSVSRLADGRFDVRFKLWDLVKGEELLGQSNAALPADLRLAAHRIADSIYEKLTGEQRRVLDPHRLRHAGRPTATRCASPMPTARAGRSRWPAPSRSSRRPGRPTARSWPTSPSKARRPWSGCRTSAPASAACWPTSAAPTARRPGRPTAATWR